MTTVNPTHRNNEPVMVRTNLILQRFATIEEAEHIRMEWDEFVEKETGDVFLTYDWCRVWWKYYGRGREPIIYIIRNKGAICGIVPMFREIIGFGPISVKVVKLMCSDFSPVTIPIAVQKEYLEVGFTLVLNELMMKYSFDLLYIGALSGRYPNAEVLVSTLQKKLGDEWVVELKESDVQTYFSIQDSWEKQIESMSKWQRRNFRRVYKEISNRGLSLVSDYGTHDTWSSMFDRFVEMHQAHWQKIGMPGHFSEWPYSYNFHKEVAGSLIDLDRLRLAEIKLDNHCIGYDYAYRLGNTYCWFLIARVGLENEKNIDFLNVAFGEKVQKAMKEGVTFIDAMRGQYDYKIMLGGKPLPVKSVYVLPVKNLKSLKVKLFRWLVWFMNILYLKIWRRRLAPRFGILPGRYFNIWVRSHMLSS